MVIFFVHAFGWGTLGLLAFSAEAVRQHDHGKGWLRSGFRAALHASSLTLPLLIMVLWRTESSGGMTGDWFNWDAKWRWIQTALRDRWRDWDKLSVAIPAAVLVFALFSRRLTFSRNLAFSALVLLAGFLLLPRIIFGSAYADMRLFPFVLATAVLAIRFSGPYSGKTPQVLAVLGLAFFLLRIGSTTASLAIASDRQAARLGALDVIPMGARVATLVGTPCGFSWPLSRDSHLGALVIVRRHGFSNDQWTIAGTNLLKVRYTKPGAFDADPSEIVRPENCPFARRWKIVAGELLGDWRVGDALRRLPRDSFDYLWLIDVPPFDHRLIDGMELVWSRPESKLYKIRPGAEGLPAMTPRKEAARGR